MHDVTSTCACIQPINSPNKSPNKENIFVSLQRLSRCHGTMLDFVKPWLGHGKTRKRRKIVPRPENEDGDPGTTKDVDAVTDDQPKCVTRSGRTIRKPARYRVGFSSFPDRSASIQGEDVRNVIK